MALCLKSFKPNYAEINVWDTVNSDAFPGDYSKLIRLTSVARLNDKVFPVKESLPYHSFSCNLYLYPKGQSSIRKDMVKDDRQHLLVLPLKGFMFFVLLILI